MCPRTLDYLARAVMIGIQWGYTPRDCDAIAAGINKVLAAL
jgi:hypothetical protein